MLLKVCGVRGPGTERDIEMLSAAEVDLVGLWHGVPGGAADLPTAELVQLAAVAREKGVEPVLVTFESDAAALAEVVRKSGVRWVQLHSYQLPGVVRELRGSLRRTRVTVVKVLHALGRRFVDLRGAPAYERAGVDAFLLDVTTGDGRVGSTGEAMPPELARSVADRLGRPFLLAGGISAANRWRYRKVARHRGFAGIDVSTGARDEGGRLHAARVEAIDRAWRGGRTENRDVALR